MIGGDDRKIYVHNHGHLLLLLSGIVTVFKGGCLIGLEACQSIVVLSQLTHVFSVTFDHICDAMYTNNELGKISIIFAGYVTVSKDAVLAF